MAQINSYGLLIRLVPYLLGHGFSGFRPFSDVVKAYDRLELWDVAWHSTVQNPWLGIGPQHFITFMERGPGSPHNIFLQWLSEWGVIATLCIVLTLSWGALSFLRGLRVRLNEGKLSLQQQCIQISVLWACVSAMVHAQISGILITPMSQLLMVLVVGYCLSVHNKEGKKGESYVKSSNAFEQVVYCLMNVMILFLSLAFYMIFYWEFIEGGYPISLDGESMAPRFWQNGAFHL
ncbi:O-antigen ligase family protein [Endozoicomonas arenosclerae]|uniref:O-antigen ligase family protein n=1 Tax=Endozoicomonas arenosclerae TaxID=1633495 RepID=UPI0015614DE4|nr:O-antigen ligase family protein [Endozoicomonas arenosclerae]